jgi:CO dehydrogenase/acetyl-CoA synthase epsilon subunit
MDILKKLDVVKAPSGFEQQVMAQLSLRKRSERRRRTALRWSLAGSLASAAVVFVVLSTVVFRDRGPVGIVGGTADRRPAASLVRDAAAEQAIAIIETLDYMTEFRRRSLEPETIYLLEQVSDTTSREIKY